MSNNNAVFAIESFEMYRNHDNSLIFIKISNIIICGDKMFIRMRVLSPCRF